MKRNQKLIGILIGALMTVSLVGCTSEQKTPAEEGSASKVEKNKESTNEQPKEEEKETETEQKQEEVVLVDDESVKIILTGKTSDMFGAGVDLVIENKLDQKILVQSRETSVDGVMEDPIFSEEIMPGKKAKGNLQFMNVTELENLINIEGKLLVMDENFQEILSYNINIK